MATSPFLPTLSSSLIFFFFFFFLFLLLLISVFSTSLAAKLSPKPVSDEEISAKKQICYDDIECGLWGEQCRSSMIHIENCALRCVSPVCYELIYEGDPLEEGERDYIRSQEYRYCMRRVSVGLNVDGVKGTFSNIQLDMKSPSMSLPGSVRIVGVKRN